MLSHLNSRLCYIQRFCCRYFASTIFAVSSGQGKCGVAVVRVSGAQAGIALKTLTGMNVLPKPRYAVLKHIKNPVTEEIVDKGIVIWFPGPKSYTGEDSCEFQIHGGSAVITAVLTALGTIDHLRIAEPGEFTKRAFYNAKLDLTEVEGISDLLAAETEVQRKQAFLQAQGSLSNIYHSWRNVLVKCVAHLEAHIDFDETEVIEDNILNEVTQSVRKLSNEVVQHLVNGRKGECLRNGVRTVIVGEPNAGKSSLFNVLCQRPAAIVTPIEGTTRDVLETILDINGYPLLLTDTAGLRSSTKDIIEQEGIQRALNAYKSADLILLLIDYINYSTWFNANPHDAFINYLKAYLAQLNIRDLLNDDDNNLFNKPTIVVLNKSDLIDDSNRQATENLQVSLISCQTQSGILLLVEEITSKLKLLCGDPSKEHPNMNQMRHRHYLITCKEYLDRFLSNSENNMDVVLMAEELRKALRQIGKITGTITTEQLLDVIFKEFCIGK